MAKKLKTIEQLRTCAKCAALNTGRWEIKRMTWICAACGKEQGVEEIVEAARAES